jgi:hypothetical protein
MALEPPRDGGAPRAIQFRNAKRATDAGQHD